MIPERKSFLKILIDRQNHRKQISDLEHNSIQMFYVEIRGLKKGNAKDKSIKELFKKSNSVMCVFEVTEKKENKSEPIFEYTLDEIFKK